MHTLKKSTKFDHDGYRIEIRKIKKLYHVDVYHQDRWIGGSMPYQGTIYSTSAKVFSRILIRQHKDKLLNKKK